MTRQYSHKVCRCQLPTHCCVTSHLVHVKSHETQKQRVSIVQKVCSLRETKNEFLYVTTRPEYVLQITAMCHQTAILLLFNAANFELHTKCL